MKSQQEILEDLQKKGAAMQVLVHQIAETILEEVNGEVVFVALQKDGVGAVAGLCVDGGNSEAMLAAIKGNIDKAFKQGQ